MKQVKILCGPSGCGKSSYVELLRKDGNRKIAVCSADDYFTNWANGKYEFDASKLGQAHNLCLLSFVDNVSSFEKDLTIIVDNTNTSAAEVAPYAALALAYECDLEIVLFQVREDMIEKLAARNVHQVPENTIRRQMDRFLKLKENLPPYWKTRMVEVKGL